MSNLNQNDLASLIRSFITAEIAEQAKLRRVDDQEGAAIVGRSGGAGSDYSGIVFPYFLPSEPGKVRENRLRRDTPDLERSNDGTTKEKGKYVSPPGRSNMIYFPPGCSHELLRNPTIPIVITEGEKKSLALNRVAWHGLGDAAETPRFLALGLPGVWNFRGTVAKMANAKGKRQAVKGVINDFSFISLESRTLTILYDSNARTNESVRAARNMLAKEMRELGANCFIAECPEISGCNGIDDVLGTWERSDGVDRAVEKCLSLIEAAEKSKPGKISQASQLLRIAGDLEVFHTPDGVPYARIEVDGHIEHHKVSSQPFKQRLAFQLYRENGKGPSSQAVQDAVQVISGQALFEGSAWDVHLRIAEYCGKIYLDLCNEGWKIIEIDKTGWRIIEAKESPIIFRRTGSMRPLPIPAATGNVKKIRNFLNVNDKNLALILGWLINAFRPGYPFPILLLSGEQGTAKSTATKVLRDLIDPSVTPFRSSPRNEHDLVIAATGSWVIGVDNLSSIPDWLSDAFCRLSTGGGFGARRLYTDDEEAVFNAKRPIVLNGIGDLASRSDLLDRSLVVRLEPIPQHRRKTESSFWKEFEIEKSEILAGLLSAVSCGLRGIGEVNLCETPRMADFAHWVVACEPGLELPKDAFLNAYIQNRIDAHAIVLEDSLLAEVIQEFCEQGATEGEYRLCDILLKDFLSQLRAKAGDRRANDKHFPKSSKGLRNGIDRISPNLREIGIHITFHGRTGAKARRGASLSLEYERNQTSQTSHDSAHEITSADQQVANAGPSNGHHRDLGESDVSDVCDVVLRP